MQRFALGLFLSFVVRWPSALHHGTTAKQLEQLEQGFLFDYDPPGTTAPIPITEQCERLHLTWDRSTATGPSPHAPYYLQIYTSAFIVPFVVDAGSGTTFDFDVPFIPGTQYQICMFDTNGISGGCQAIYTVIANTTSQTPSCTNVTFPAGAMDVEAEDHQGQWSQYGWVEECTDITVTPKNGTPPYTFTVAPALRPPLNITSTSRDAISWTVSLDFGFPFFISLVDSQGNKWSNGPLHSSLGTTTCRSRGSVSPAAAIGSGIGGLVLGALIGVIGLLLFRLKFGGLRYKRAAKDILSPKSSYDINPLAYHDPSDIGMPPMGSPDSPDAFSGSSRANASQHNQAYHIEPFTLSGREPSSTAPGVGALSSDPSATSSTQSNSPHDVPHPPSHPLTASESRVYVVHHDGGGAPVTVYTDNGAEVVELPPNYADSRRPPPPRPLQSSDRIRKPPRGAYRLG
ncbi:hypothetical protein OF83DRAFT_1169305 [Amylostereum chailletii]|nr:hypothetical protein OF83DRAFT_1169305 [Amylostereum chailletii]